MKTKPKIESSIAGSIERTYKHDLSLCLSLPICVSECAGCFIYEYIALAD